MAGKPARPSESARPGEGEESDERTTLGAEDGEHTGSIAISRLRKADGRALILYSTARERA